MLDLEGGAGWGRAWIIFIGLLATRVLGPKILRIHVVSGPWAYKPREIIVSGHWAQQNDVNLHGFGALDLKSHINSHGNGPWAQEPYEFIGFRFRVPWGQKAFA